MQRRDQRLPLTNGNLSRRTALGLATGSLTAFATRATKVSAAPAIADPADVLPRSPDAGLTSFIRMFANLSGTSVFSNEGLIYGKVDGELPRPLFGFVSVLEIRPKQMEPGLWRSEQKEAMVCLDMATRMPITTFRNPYTGKDNFTLGYISPVNVYFFDQHGSGFRERPKPAQTSRIWRSSATDVWVTESRYNYFPASISEAEFPLSYAGPVRRSVDVLTYRASALDFADQRQQSVPVQLTMMSDTPWPLWMEMGKRGGSAFYHGSGQKYRRLADMGSITRRAVDAAYPGFLADPWGYPAEQWGTAAQMRRLRAEGRL